MIVIMMIVITRPVTYSWIPKKDLTNPFRLVSLQHLNWHDPAKHMDCGWFSGSQWCSLVWVRVNQLENRPAANTREKRKDFEQSKQRNMVNMSKQETKLKQSQRVDIFPFPLVSRRASMQTGTKGSVGATIRINILSANSVMLSI